MIFQVLKDKDREDDKGHRKAIAGVPRHSRVPDEEDSEDESVDTSLPRPHHTSNSDSNHLSTRGKERSKHGRESRLRWSDLECR
jgi:hypothetical protein